LAGWRGWLVGKVGWLAGWLVGSLAGWLVGWLAGWRGWQVWLVGCWFLVARGHHEPICLEWEIAVLG